MSNWKIKFTEDGTDYWLQESIEQFFYIAKTNRLNAGRNFYFLPNAQATAVILNDQQKDQAIKNFPAYIPVAFTIIDTGNFALLAGNGLANSGNTLISGDIGSFPTLLQTGFETAEINGIDHGGDTDTQAAKLNLEAAIVTGFSAGPPVGVSEQLGGTTKLAGVYGSPTGSFLIDGELILDAAGNPANTFIFQMSDNLVIGNDAKISLVNGAVKANVLFVAQGNTSIGKNAIVNGLIYIDGNIVSKTNATINGKLGSLNGKITIANNTIEI